MELVDHVKRFVESDKTRNHVWRLDTPITRAFGSLKVKGDIRKKSRLNKNILTSLSRFNKLSTVRIGWLRFGKYMALVVLSDGCLPNAKKKCQKF
jgi:hypothetical protein